jgi:hypothetical protein
MQDKNSNTRATSKLGRLIFALLMVGIVSGIAIAVARARNADRARHIVLTDGTQVELLQVSAGNATFTTDSKWQQIARRYLPGPFQGWLPGVSSTTTTGSSNDVTVYMRITKPAGTPVTSPPWRYYVTEDANGSRYSRESGYFSFLGPGPQTIYGFSLQAYPRREREFLFQMLDSNEKIMGSFRIENPLSGTFPAWKPLALPQTRTNGPVILTLKGLEERGGKSWPFIGPEWSVEAIDPAWINAAPRSKKLLDSTGNSSSEFLSFKESAWKLQTSVYRTRLQDFAPNEKLAITNLAVPTAGNFIPVNQSTDCAGVKISLLALAGAGTLTVSNGVANSMSATAENGYSSTFDGHNKIETWGSSTPFLWVTAQNTKEGDHIEIHITNETGKEIYIEQNGENSQSGARIFCPSLTLPPEVKSLSVHIIVNRPLHFEFMVNPKDVVRKR